jgi:3-deoxy-D-manno-octulosonic-acid transferase
MAIDHVRYNLALAVGSPLVAAYLMNRYATGKSRPGWRERWGELPQGIATGANSARQVWVHAVSAGEVVAATPILRELRACLPTHRLLLSVITPAGYEMACQQAMPFVDGLFYFPFDLPWVARHVVRQIQPAVFVTMESELWPNLLHELKRSGTRTVMVNGRISERNFARVQRYARGLFRWMLSNVDRLLMQSAGDALRVRDLGGISDPGRVVVIGNSKFDQDLPPMSADEVDGYRASLRLPPGGRVLLAGSTRSRDEEAVVISAYERMRDEMPDLCLIIAPRHIERAAEVEQHLQQHGLSPVRRTQLSDANSTTRHLVLDTMGELARLYSVADVTFVGNSFPPVNKGGGQNLLQPLAQGKPVLVGPETATIRAELALAKDHGVCFQVGSAAELASVGLRLLKDDGLRQRIAEQARDLISANRGVSLRYAKEIARLTGGPEFAG